MTATKDPKILMKRKADWIAAGGIGHHEKETTYMSKPSDIQVGGQHYKDMAIQPTEYITKNKLGFIEGNIIKYISRWRQKNGIEDLKKIKHYVDLLIEYEGLEEKKPEGCNMWDWNHDRVKINQIFGIKTDE